MTDRRKENNEVMHSACKDGSQKNPSKARAPAILGRQYRTYKRACAGNGSKVMTEEHPLVRRHKLASIVATIGRSYVRVIKHENFSSNKCGIIAIRQNE